MKKVKSVQQYLDSIRSNTYSHLAGCIQSETDWQNDQIRTNPAMFELFSTHQHLGTVREQLFVFSGTILNKEDLVQLANALEEHWRKALPTLFPGYDFAILKDSFSEQAAFCRVRKGITNQPGEVMKYMRDPNSNIRWNALLSAALYPNPVYVPYLLDALSDENTFNVIQALHALGNCGEEKTVDLLLQHFTSQEGETAGELEFDEFIAGDLLETLLKLGQSGFRVLFQLLRNYEHLNPALLDCLCEVIGKTAHPEVLELLLKVYFTCPDCSEGALNGLLKMEEPAYLKIAPFTKDNDPHYREKAMWFLANCCIPEARPILKTGLEDKNPAVREAAAHGIGRFAADDRISLLLKAGHDGCVRVRARALKALGSLYDDKLLPLFEYHCYDKSPVTRFEAMCAITNLNKGEGIRFLTNLFSESGTRDKLRILYSLYGYSGRRSLLGPLIKKARSDKNKTVRRELENLLLTQGLI